MSLADEMAETTKNALEALEDMRMLREANKRAEMFEKQAKERFENEQKLPGKIVEILSAIEQSAQKGSSSYKVSWFDDDSFRQMVEDDLRAKGFKVEFVSIPGGWYSSFLEISW